MSRRPLSGTGLTCAGVHACLLGHVVVLVPSAAAVDEAFTASCLAVVVPVLKRRPTRPHLRLRPTTLWVGKQQLSHERLAG